MPCEIATIAPTPRPSVNVPITMTTGKVSAMAARGSVPSRPTKKVSTTLKAIIATIPTSIGAESRTSVAPMGPEVSFALVACAHMGAILRDRCPRDNRRFALAISFSQTAFRVLWGVGKGVRYLFPPVSRVKALVATAKKVPDTFMLR